MLHRISRDKDVDGFHLYNVGGLVVGDTIFPPCTPFGVMKLLEYEGVDVAILPIGGFYVMDAEDAARAVGFIKPIVAIPIHYDTFTPIKADPAKFEAHMNRLGADARVEILKPGDTLEV